MSCYLQYNFQLQVRIICTVHTSTNQFSHCRKQSSNSKLIMMKYTENLSKLPWSGHRYWEGEWIGNAVQYYTRSSVQLF